MVPQPDTEENYDNNRCRKYKCICIFDLFLAVSYHYICVLFSLESLMFFYLTFFPHFYLRSSKIQSPLLLDCCVLCDVFFSSKRGQ